MKSAERREERNVLNSAILQILQINLIAKSEKIEHT